MKGIPGNTAMQKVTRKVPAQLLVISGILLFLIIFFSLFSHRFISTRNLMNIIRQSSYIIMTGSVVTILMISGHFDLSVGSVAALSGVTMALLAQSGVPLGLAILAAVGIGLVAGMLNALVVTYFDIPPFIGTLGTMFICRGMALIVTNGFTVRENLPENYKILGHGTVMGIPNPVIIMLVIVGIALVVQKKTIIGKYSIAIGGNTLAARLSGINVGRMVSIYYLMIGAVVGLTGAVQSSRLGVGEPNIGGGFEFDVIIAVILGGTALEGGKGSIIGMIIGALIVMVIGNGLNLLGVLTFYQSIIKGVILVVAVLIDQSLRDAGSIKLKTKL